MTKEEEQKLVWDRLKDGVDNRTALEKARNAFLYTGRQMGKTTLAMQALGRALRKMNDDI